MSHQSLHALKIGMRRRSEVIVLTQSMRTLLFLLLVASTVHAQNELDLSETSTVEGVLVLPGVLKIVSAPKVGGLIGVDTRKTTEKFETIAHAKVVESLSKELAGRVIPAAATLGALDKNKITPAQIKNPDAIAKIANATNVAWVVVLDGPKTNGLFASICGVDGKQVGTTEFVGDAKNTDELTKKITAQLAMLSKIKADAAAKAKPVAVVVAPPPPEEDVKDAELELMNRKTVKQDENEVDAEFIRGIISVGPGGAIRNATISGSASSSLAELQNQNVAGLGVYASVSPLKFVASLRKSRFSDVFVDFNYRRAFVFAKGIQGAVTGLRCSMNDEEFSIRGGYRIKVLNGTYGTTVGIAGAFTQENTEFLCDLPVLSTAYRGIDAQLKIRQPLYKNMVTLDVAGGPRFLLSGNNVQSGAFSFGGEAWIEVKPINILFVRGGIRASRLSLNSETISVTEQRAFFGLEVGAFL
jgi:hypothetical protein